MSESANNVAARQFPETRDSLVQALRSTGEDARTQAFGLVVRAYRAPVIALLSRQWSLDVTDAEDLAHDFFSAALEKEWFARYDSSRGRFRTFLRSCLVAFASDDHDRKHSLKRGGGARHEELREDSATHAATSLDDLFEQEWIRSVLQISLDALTEEAASSGHKVHAELFRRYDIEGSDLDVRPTYAALASEFSLPATQVTNYLAWARKRFRQHVLNTVRALTGSDEEYREEVQILLGVDVP